jgi:hypothetical protein
LSDLSRGQDRVANQAGLAALADQLDGIPERDDRQHFDGLGPVTIEPTWISSRVMVFGASEESTLLSATLPSLNARLVGCSHPIITRRVYHVINLEGNFDGKSSTKSK